MAGTILDKQRQLLLPAKEHQHLWHRLLGLLSLIGFASKEVVRLPSQAPAGSEGHIPVLFRYTWTSICKASTEMLVVVVLLAVVVLICVVCSIKQDSFHPMYS